MDRRRMMERRRGIEAGRPWLGAVLVAVLAVGAAGLGGCAVNTNPRGGELDPALPYPRVMINDDELARGLAFDEPIVVRDDKGFIVSVEVTVRARSVTPLRVDYRPVFMDANGVLLQPASMWRTKHLEMRVPERILMRPSGRNAKDYEIQFRWAQ